MRYGLWQSEYDVREGLNKLTTKTEKLWALKAQLEFRKKVLEQTGFDKESFFLSKNGKQLSVQEISSN